MSIIPVHALSGSDLRMLGNNLRPPVPRRRPVLAAINRSLATYGERVGRLHPTPIAAAAARPAQPHA